MRRSFSIWLGFWLVASLLLCLPNAAFAQGKKAKESRLQGTVQTVSKSDMMLTLQLDNSTATREVTWDANTKVLKGSSSKYETASMDDLKDGVKVVCAGKYGDKNRLMASTIRIRQ